jgi:hypothetical protein
MKERIEEFTGYNMPELILGYVVNQEEGSIDVFYNNGLIENSTYSIELEKEILEKMKRQILEGKEYFTDFKETYKSAKEIKKVHRFILALLGNFALIYLILAIFKSAVFIGISLVLLSVICVVGESYKLINKEEKEQFSYLADLDKSVNFLNNISIRYDKVNFKEDILNNKKIVNEFILSSNLDDKCQSASFELDDIDIFLDSSDKEVQDSKGKVYQKKLVKRDK